MVRPGVWGPGPMGAHGAPIHPGLGLRCGVAAPLQVTLVVKATEHTKYKGSSANPAHIIAHGGLAGGCCACPWLASTPYCLPGMNRGPGPLVLGPEWARAQGPGAQPTRPRSRRIGGLSGLSGTPLDSSRRVSATPDNISPNGCFPTPFVKDLSKKVSRLGWFWAFPNLDRIRPRPGLDPARDPKVPGFWSFDPL